MTKKELFWAINDLDEEFIDEALKYKNKGKRYYIILTMAACFFLVFICRYEMAYVYHGEGTASEIQLVVMPNNRVCFYELSELRRYEQKNLSKRLGELIFDREQILNYDKNKNTVSMYVPEKVYKEKGKDNYAKIILKVDGKYWEAEFLSFLIETVPSESESALTNIMGHEYDYSAYTFGTVLEEIYGVSDKSDITQILLKPSEKNICTIDDPAVIHEIYSITKDMKVVGDDELAPELTTEKIKRRKRKSDEKLSSIFYFQLKDGQKIILYYLQSYGAFVSNDEDYYVPLSDEDMRKIERIIKKYM